MQTEFEEIKNLLNLSDWPSAVYPDLICNTEDDKTERAEQIVDSILGDLTGKKFIDFGCGEGHIVKEASKTASLAVGYDIVVPERPTLVWGFGEKYKLTNDYTKIKELEKYDVALVYDVLDHTKDPVALLKSLVNLMHKDSKIYVRCHPWCSVHGGHVYRTINKSHVHVVLSREELVSLGDMPTDYPEQQVIHPIVTYNRWFSQAGLKIVEQDIQKEPVPSFLKNNPVVKKRIAHHWRNDGVAETRDFPEFQLSQSYHDYVLNLC